MGNHAPELPLIALRLIIPESNAIVPMTMPPLVISLNCMYVFYGLLNIIQFNIYIVGLFPMNAVPLLDIWFEWSLPK